MKSNQVTISKMDFSDSDFKNIKEANPSWITVFGHTSFFETGDLGVRLKKIFPNSEIIGCSTAGEISNDGVYDKRLIVTGITLKHPNLKMAWSEVNGIENSRESGKNLTKQFSKDGLNGIFVLSQGINVNGSELINGMKENVNNEIIITGGLAGDAGSFKKTYVICNEKVGSNITAGIAFYGNSLKITSGSMGGWQPFGPVRRVTKSKANVLYTLDGEPALSLYKKYLGEYAKDLPGSGLFFPFAILKDNGDQTGLIRTILAINEEDGSLVSAGDFPENSIVRLMTGKTDNLVKGASDAAQGALHGINKINGEESFAILVSCVGRKLVMADDTDEEVEVVQALMPNSTITGFYSYGEISPYGFISDCKLHNQTMAISYFTEIN